MNPNKQRQNSWPPSFVDPELATLAVNPAMNPRLGSEEVPTARRLQPAESGRRRTSRIGKLAWPLHVWYNLTAWNIRKSQAMNVPLDQEVIKKVNEIMKYEMGLLSSTLRDWPSTFDTELGQCAEAVTGYEMLRQELLSTTRLQNIYVGQRCIEEKSWTD
ncbi:hypothetical protein LINPERHAP1_LOCUS41518 [Linum perenne]